MNNEVLSQAEQDSANEQEAQKLHQKRMLRRRKRRIRWIVGLVILAFTAVYFAGVIYYQSRFCPGSKIHEISCANMTPAEAEQKIRDYVEHYQCKVIDGNRSQMIAGSEIALKLEQLGNLQEAKERQNPWKWFLFSTENTVRAGMEISLDEELLNQKIEELPCISEAKASITDMSARVRYQDEEQRFYLEGEELPNSMPGEIASANRVWETVNDAIRKLESGTDLRKKGCYVNFADEAKVEETIQTMNRYVAAKIEYQNSAGEQVAYLDGGSIHLWVSVDEAFQMRMDESKVAEYVSQLAAKYDTLGGAHRFTATGAGAITVYGGDYGWRVNQEEETAKVVELIHNGATETRQPVYSHTAKASAPADIGDSYIEVSLGAQKMWLYQGGKQTLASNVVTGNPNRGNGTTPGVYTIKYKERNATLVGRDYRTPVSYWMPFHGGQGLHDASWRGSFGGRIYLSNGSHGCVNLPPGVAKTLFEAISAGYPVVVY